jgi:hypothetical protein
MEEDKKRRQISFYREAARQIRIIEQKEEHERMTRKLREKIEMLKELISEKDDLISELRLCLNEKDKELMQKIQMTVPNSLEKSKFVTLFSVPNIINHR